MPVELPSLGDHLWFIPVTGGGAFGAVPATWAALIPPWEFNVQWNFSNFPTAEPAAAQACVNANPSVVFTRSNSVEEANKLNNCFGRWTWRSCSDGLHVTVGGQLGVGTVFARMLSLDNNTAGPPSQQVFDIWDRVEVWAKFRVSDLTKLSAIFLGVNDMGGNSSAANVTLPAPAWNNQWYVGYHNVANWQGWDDPATNLRVALTFLGTTIPANVGEVHVDVEWFAIRLHSQRHP